MQQDKHLPCCGLHAEHEAFVFSNGGGSFGKSDQQDAIGLCNTSLRPGRIDIRVYTEIQLASAFPIQMQKDVFERIVQEKIRV